MIRVNLLKNQLNVSETRPKPPTDSTTSTAIRREARKNSRLFVFLILFFLILIGGSIAAYVFRYPLVAFIEKYTGTLNLLAPEKPEITEKKIEELRREKIRTQYMLNTLKIQKRNHSFFARIDSLDQINDRIWIAKINLDVNDFNIEIYGKREKDLSDFFVQLIATANTELLKQSDSKVTSVIRGYTLKKTITGSLKVTTETLSENYSTPLFYPADTILLKIRTTAQKTGVKLKKMETQSVINRGVVLDKIQGKAEAEAISTQLILFIQQIAEMKLNMEWISYSLSYTRQTGKRKTKPDLLNLSFEIFIPNREVNLPSTDH